MNRPSQKSQRFVLAGLLVAIIVIAMVTPNIIDIYTGAPRIRAPGADDVQLPTTETTPMPIKSMQFVLRHPTLTPSPRAQSLQNCTLPVEYWRSHPDSWPSQGMTFGSLVLDKETALTVINSTAKDVQVTVLRQLIVYSLNSLHGADPSPVIAAVKELSSWLNTYGSAAAVPEPDRLRGLALAKSLEAFNRGLNGPSPCPEITDTPTPTITTTPSPTLSPTPSATNTTPPPTPRPLLPFPTATNQPNPPPQPTTAPTQPPPPTAAPTQPPPPTAAPTQPPPPTAVPTLMPTPTSPP
jgi:hypothetical protein